MNNIIYLEGDPYALTIPNSGMLEYLFEHELLQHKGKVFSYHANEPDLQVLIYENGKMTYGQWWRDALSEKPIIPMIRDDYHTYFMLIPMDKNKGFDQSFSANYSLGETIQLGSFFWDDMKQDAQALLQIPIMWDPTTQSIQDCDSPSIEWIHFNGMLVSKYPYYKIDMETAIKENYILRKK